MLRERNHYERGWKSISYGINTPVHFNFRSCILGASFMCNQMSQAFQTHKLSTQLWEDNNHSTEQSTQLKLRCVSVLENPTIKQNMKTLSLACPRELLDVFLFFHKIIDFFFSLHSLFSFIKRT